MKTMAFEVSRTRFCWLKTHRIVSKNTLMVKANIGGFKSVDHMVNGKKVNGVSHLSSKNLSDQLPKQIDNVNEHAYVWLLGRFVEDTFVYRQTFVIRSYEIGPDKTATMETLMNLLQETALNHVTGSGLAGNGFGATQEMSLRKLIWVVTRIHVQVEKYSSWGDVIDIETWVDAAGNNGVRRDWIIRERNTQKIITRATSTWVMMNRETRKLSKIPSEVRKEVQPFYLDRAATYTDLDKIGKLNDENSDIIRSGLAPRWSDMDANQHVNNVKYIGWILESVPIDVLEHYNLTSMTLEYRRECRLSNVLESLTTINPKMTQHSKISTNYIEEKEELKSTHLIRMQDDKVEIVRAKSVWKSKQKNTT